MRVVIAGGTGFIGRRLAAALKERGDEVVVLSRSAKAEVPGATVAVWDARVGGGWEAALEGADAVVNLCGEGVADAPWTEGRRKALVDSRLGPTSALTEAFTRMEKRPSVLVNASAVGFYGARGDEELTEGSASGMGFLSDLCRRWELEAKRAAKSGARVVLLRIGVVLGREGGALARMLPVFKLGLGGRLGGGGQWFPWIHVDDVVGLTLAAIDRKDLEGPVNAVAPEPATNAEFTQALAGVLRRPAFFAVPGPALKLALGEMSTMLLGSQKVLPAAALEKGCRFRHPSLKSALADLLETRR